jgi:phosphoribosylformylglycinamidine synthase
MSPYEILLSESQERMLLVAARGREGDIRGIFAKWELDAVQIGRVTAEGDLTVRADGAVVARLPVQALSDAPAYEKAMAVPAELAARRAVDPLALPEPADGTEALEAVLASPTVASKAWAYRQYDQQVGLNSLVLPGSDAAVLRVKGTRRGLAVATDGNARQVALDPRLGAAMAVAEAARNVSCAGARPLGVTDCLNFGSPERPEILWQFAQAIDGIAEACRALELPVVGGNVSFYNETSGQAILPTPIIGVVGLLDEAERHVTQWFKGGGRIALLGLDEVSLGGSEYLWIRHGVLGGQLAPLDLALEARVQAAARAAIQAGLVTACHDCSEGGLAVALAEGCVSGPRPVGCAVALEQGGRLDVALFGEGPSRILVEVAGGGVPAFETLMRERGIPWRWIGESGGPRMVVRLGGRTVVDADLARLGSAWRNGFERHVG